MDDRWETDQLAELIGQKHDILEQIRQLSRRQDDLIREGDMPQLMTLLAAKETLLGRLQRVERELDPYRHQDPDSRNWRTTEHRQRCRQVAERCESLLKEILLLEKQGESALTTRRDQVAARLQGMHTAQEAHSAYTRGSGRPSQLDLSSDQ